MRSNRQLAIVLLALLPVAVAPACNDTKVIPPSNGHLAVKVFMEPPVGARSASSQPFEWGQVTLSAVVLKPTNATEDQVIGRGGINGLETNYPADLIATTESDLNTVSVPAGTYTLDHLSILKFVVNTSPADPLVDLTGGRCDGDVVTAVSLPVSAESGGDTTIRPEGVITVAIPEGGEGVLTIVIDGEGLTTLLDSHAACSGGVFSVAPPPPPPPAPAPPVITASDVTTLLSYR